MAASFPYNSEDYQPPAPLLSLSASVPFLDTRAEEVHALCGTGADICCLPRMLVERLGLIEVDEIEIAGYEGPSQRKPVFAVQIRIEGKAPLIVRG